MKLKDANKENMPPRLPIFEGYCVDVRLKEFRKVNNQQIDFISFQSKKGEKILNRYIKTLNPESKEFKVFIHYF